MISASLGQQKPLESQDIGITHLHEGQQACLDPVCGMEVEESKVPENLRSERLAHSFYFCSQACKDEFDRNPQQCVGPPAA